MTEFFQPTTHVRANWEWVSYVHRTCRTVYVAHLNRTLVSPFCRQRDKPEAFTEIECTARMPTDRFLVGMSSHYVFLDYAYARSVHHRLHTCMVSQENNVAKQRTCYALFFCCAEFSPIYDKQPRPYHWH